MANPIPPEIDRFPIAHSVRYVARGLPEVPNQYGPGTLAPSEITLTYRAAEDSQLGRVHAYVAGRLWVDGTEVPLLSGGLYGQHYDAGLDGWPEWLAAEARLHDPDAEQAADPCTDPIECGHEAALGNAEMKLDQIRGKAAEWQALAPADDWGLTPQDTALADVGRFLLRLIDDGAVPAAETQQPGTETEAHPAEHAWAAELYDPLANEWVPGTRYAVRDRAVTHLDHGRSIGPTWKDGTPTRRRLVRATTTYTVEDPAAVAAEEQPETQTPALSITVDELAYALDNSTPYPVELHSNLCRLMAEQLLEMTAIRRRPEHVVWQPDEEPPTDQPDPIDPATLQDRLRCPQCGEDITDYAEDDHVYLDGDERPYCSGECVAAAQCTCAAAGPAFVPAGHYADCPNAAASQPNGEA